MSMTLYKNGLKGSWKLLLILAAVLAMYLALVTSMFDPTLGAALDEFSKTMPQIMAMFSMTIVGTNLTAFTANYLYGFIMLVFPMVYAVVTANRLVAKAVDQGSMAYLLAAPISRFKIAFTQMKVIATGVFALVGFASIVGLASAEALFPGELNLAKFLLINLGVLCLQFFISGICFLTSCVFNDTKYSIGFGAGIPALALIIQMLANTGGKFENAKYATFFTLYNTKGIISGDSAAFWGMAALAIGAVLLYSLAIVVFTKKDMPV